MTFFYRVTALLTAFIGNSQVFVATTLNTFPDKADCVKGSVEAVLSHPTRGSAEDFLGTSLQI